MGVSNYSELNPSVGLSDHILPGLLASRNVSNYSELNPSVGEAKGIELLRFHGYEFPTIPNLTLRLGEPVVTGDVAIHYEFPTISESTHSVEAVWHMLITYTPD